MKRAVIILPTYNESLNIQSLIESIFKVAKEIPNWELQILVVDSRSTDDTGTIVKRLTKTYPSLKLLVVEKEGLGKAYVHGFTYVLNHLNPFVVFEMDADWSHNPKDIPQFLHKIEKGADFVIGSRYMKGGSIPQNWSWYRKIFSIFGNLIARIGFMKPKITEWTNGFRSIKVWLIKAIIPEMDKYSGYVFQVAFLDKALKKDAYIEQVPIQFKDRTKGVSKINSFQYIWQTLLYVFLNSSFIKFVIVGLIGFGIDFGLSFFFIEKAHWVVWAATFLSTETAIVSNFLFNNFWSFSHKKLEHRLSAYIPSFLKFNLVSSGSILIQVVGVQLLVNIFGRHLWYFYKVLIITFIIIPYSYILYNKFIWKKK